MFRINQHSGFGTTELFGKGTPAGTLLGSNREGLAIDFANNNALVRWPGSGKQYSGNVTGLLTYTSPSRKMVFGSDGLLKFAQHNGIRRTDDLTNGTYWSPQDSSVTTNVTGTIAPPAELPSNTPVFKHKAVDGGWGGHETYANNLDSSSGINTGDIVVMSAYVKDNDAGFAGIGDGSVGGISPYGSVQFSDQTTMTNGLEDAFTVTDKGGGWYLLELRYTKTDDTVTMGVGPRNAKSTSFSNFTAATPGQSIYICGFHLYRYPMHGTPTYLENATSSPKYSIPLDHDPEDSNAPLGVLLEDARTALELYCRDLTQTGSWTATNITPTLDQIGVDGISNSASRLAATAASGTIFQSITSASATRTFQPFVKRITGTGMVEVTLDGGVTYTDITSTIDGGTGAYNGYHWFAILQYTVTDPQIGFRISVSGDEIAVDFCNCMSSKYRSSPIVTTTAQVTRTKDNVSLSTTKFPINSESLAVYHKFRPVDLVDDGNDNVPISFWGMNAGWQKDYRHHRTDYSATKKDHLRIQDTISTIMENNNILLNEQVYKWCLTVSVGQQSKAFDGSVISTGTRSTYMPVPNTLYLGFSFSSGNLIGGMTGRAHFLEFVVFGRALSDAEAQARTSW